ncbi:hypothetical protein BU26DRAFT_37797 [Trematosphaeria pertusa]|uniref:Uncharacterized protein n=1 Tax=Trematosphaeria pertusa TaxID=390896 RepID=A0A6A6J4N3_9PLEO|nr:uncharacterized protein BU26DRAFT_37797 [Trematosphaeria pertusa]KAF2257182.1 hypothetical protein BU26DRAFT_37797 [Trematosphaeria pertusa]
MAALAFKALHYGADRLPDKVWESIPGGFFTPPEKKKTKTNRRPIRENRYRSEQRQSDRGRRRSHRERTPPTDYSDYSGYDDTDYEKEYRRKERRRRAKSLGRSISRSLSRSLSRGRHKQRSGDSDGEYDEHAQMDRAERGPQFPPPPASEYRPYNPQDYAPPPGAAASAAPAGYAYPDPYDRRASSARPDYGYPPQVNNAFRPRSATAPSGSSTLTSPNSFPSRLTSRPPSKLSTASLLALPSPTLDALRSGSPLGANFTPSYEPPLAAVLHRTTTNSPQPTSATAARYTPGAAYAPSPVNAAMAPPPNPGYAPYNPADYTSPSPGYRASGNAYPSPPPFYRHQSQSQPSLPRDPYPEVQTQLAVYDQPPSRHGSTSSSHRYRKDDGKHHRARFENLDLHDKNLAASVGGAGIGAIGGRELEKKYEK